MRIFKRSPKAAVKARERRSATQIYLDGGGNPADARTMALLAEADRSNQRQQDAQEAAERAQGDKPLHAHEITADDAALIRMMAGAQFGLDALVTLPSGRTISGAEMRRWLDSNAS